MAEHRDADAWSVLLLDVAKQGLKPDNIIADAAQGLRTGHVGRPGEGGPGTGETAPKGNFDVVGKNFEDFADKMGV